MFKTFYCHIGPGKTATSSIQGTFHHNEAALADHGVYVVRRPPLSTLPMFIDDPTRLFPVRNTDATPARLARLTKQEADRRAEAAASGDFDIGFMSTEHMLVLVQEEIQRLHAHLLTVANEVKIIYYARHPFSKIPSTLNQQVKLGRAPLEGSLARFLRSFEQELAPWIKVFGVENIIVRKFEVKSMPDQSPVSDICTTIGRPKLFADLQIRHSNEAISAPATVLKGLLNDKYRNQGADMGPIAYLTEIAGPKFAVHQDRILALSDEIQNELAFLRDTFGITLETPALSAEVPTRPEMFTDDVLVSIAAVLNDQACQIRDLKLALRKSRAASEN